MNVWAAVIIMELSVSDDEGAPSPARGTMKGPPQPHTCFLSCFLNIYLHGFQND